MDSWFNVAEGGKRGGKNVLQVMAFCAALEDHPGRLHLIAGVSIATARLNIIDCDGYGLMNYFDGAYRIGVYQNRDCFYIKTLRGDEKIVLVSGGGKKGDEKLIKGNTYGMAYVTEANECTPIFLKEVFDRTLSSPGRKVFHDLNPKAESHWYYEEILKHHELNQEKNNSYGYNYGHFTIADNMSISDEQLRQRISTYDQDTIWYKRDILGQRKQAEGVIYESFANNPEAYLVDADEYLKHDGKRLAAIFIGVDWGHGKSANTAVAVAITQRYKEVVVIDEFYSTDMLDPEQLYVELINMIERVEKKYGLSTCFADNAEMMMVRGLRNSVTRRRLRCIVQACVKHEILDRIVLTCSLFAQKRMKIDRKCKQLQDAFKMAVWSDSKVKDVRLDDGTSNIDSLDGYEYSICSSMEQLELAGRIQ